MHHPTLRGHYSQVISYVAAAAWLPLSFQLPEKESWHSLSSAPALVPPPTTRQHRNVAPPRAMDILIGRQGLQDGMRNGLLNRCDAVVAIFSVLGALI